MPRNSAGTVQKQRRAKQWEKGFTGPFFAEEVAWLGCWTAGACAIWKNVCTSSDTSVIRTAAESTSDHPQHLIFQPPQTPCHPQKRCHPRTAGKPAPLLHRSSGFLHRCCIKDSQRHWARLALLFGDNGSTHHPLGPIWSRSAPESCPLAPKGAVWGCSAAQRRARLRSPIVAIARPSGSRAQSAVWKGIACIPMCCRLPLTCCPG